MQTKKFTFGYYFYAVTKMLGEPRRFFSRLAPDSGFGPVFGFLLVSSLFFAAAGLITAMPPDPLLWGCILLVNALGMTFIAAGLGYMTMVMFFGRKATFIRLFSVYALASGVTLLASWMPFFIWLTEPWKWWLVGTGLVRACGLKISQALLIIGVSVGIIVLFFWSILPVIMAGKG